MRVTKVEEPDAGGQASLGASPGQGRPRHTGRLWLVVDGEVVELTGLDHEHEAPYETTLALPMKARHRKL